MKVFCPKCQDIYHPRLSRHASTLSLSLFFFLPACSLFVFLLVVLSVFVCLRGITSVFLSMHRALSFLGGCGLKNLCAVVLLEDCFGLFSFFFVSKPFRKATNSSSSRTPPKLLKGYPLYNFTLTLFPLPAIDGAFFGTSFPHMLLQTYPEYQPPLCGQSYIPRIFGFRIHSTAHEASLKAKQEAKMQRQRSMQSKEKFG